MGRLPADGGGFDSVLFAPGDVLGRIDVVVGLVEFRNHVVRIDFGSQDAPLLVWELDRYHANVSRRDVDRCGGEYG